VNARTFFRSLLLANGVFLSLLWVAGCADDPTSSRSVAGERHVYSLPAVEGTACRYGGEYPFCQPAPDALGGTDGMGDHGIDPGTDPGAPTGGGGGQTGSDVPPLCDSRKDGCLLPLSGNDNALINASLGTIKPASEFKDSRVAELCGRMQTQLQTLMSQGRIFRGADGIPDNAEHLDASHDAQAWRRPDGIYVIHVDGDVLDRAEASGGWEPVIADMLLHEAAHVLGYTHPGETSSPYTTEPFNHMTGGTGESCVR
jgi:hypothetical protein